METTGRETDESQRRGPCVSIDGRAVESKRQLAMGETTMAGRGVEAHRGAPTAPRCFSDKTQAWARGVRRQHEKTSTDSLPFVARIAAWIAELSSRQRQRKRNWKIWKILHWCLCLVFLTLPLQRCPSPSSTFTRTSTRLLSSIFSRPGQKCHISAPILTLQTTTASSSCLVKMIPPCLRRREAVLSLRTTPIFRRKSSS